MLTIYTVSIIIALAHQSYRGDAPAVSTFLAFVPIYNTLDATIIILSETLALVKARRK